MERTGICPLCNGTTRRSPDVHEYFYRQYDDKKAKLYGYDKATDTLKCYNCGQHGMYSKGPDGKVELKPDGTPCLHSFEEIKLGNCYYKYICKYCNTSHVIDSGD